VKDKAKTLCVCGRLHLGQTLIVSYCHGSMNSAADCKEYTVWLKAPKAQLDWISWDQLQLLLTH